MCSQRSPVDKKDCCTRREKKKISLLRTEKEILKRSKKKGKVIKEKKRNKSRINEMVINLGKLWIKYKTIIAVSQSLCVCSFSFISFSVVFFFCFSSFNFVLWQNSLFVSLFFHVHWQILLQSLNKHLKFIKWFCVVVLSVCFFLLFLSFQISEHHALTKRRLRNHNETRWWRKWMQKRE